MQHRVTIQGFEIAYGAGCAPGIEFEGIHNTFSENYIYLNATCLGVNALVCRDPDGGSDYNNIVRNTIDQADLGIVVVAETDDAINTGNVIQGNRIGVNAYGTGIVSNGQDGVDLVFVELVRSPFVELAENRYRHFIVHLQGDVGVRAVTLDKDDDVYRPGPDGLQGRGALDVH